MAQINAGCSRGHHNWVLDVNEVSVDEVNNKSTISYSIRLDGNNSYRWTGWGSQIGCTFSINETQRTVTLDSWGNGLWPYSGIVISSGNQVIEHEQDGTKTINISLSGFDSAGQTYTPGTASGSTTLTLTPIVINRNNIKVKVGDTWKNGNVYINVNGTWKEGTPYVNINGSWKKGI